MQSLLLRDGTQTIFQVNLMRPRLGLVRIRPFIRQQGFITYKFKKKFSMKRNNVKDGSFK